MDQAQATQIFRTLETANPDPVTELLHENPFQLLIATILSAQCTDERVNQVTRVLFSRCPDPRALAGIATEELEEIVKPTGFFRNKARSVKDCSRVLLEDFGGEVPSTMEALLRLPGVGRKTANLILGDCFGVPGLVVDTHVKRTAARLGLTTETDAERVELDLERWLPPADRYLGSSRLLLHGRYVCVAKKPKCAECVLYDLCEFPGKTV